MQYNTCAQIQLQKHKYKYRNAAERVHPCRIHSKSEDPDPNDPAKKWELSANLSKNATKWPKNDPKWPKVAQI